MVSIENHQQMASSSPHHQSSRFHPSPSLSTSSRIQRSQGRSMRTIRSNLYQPKEVYPENLTDSMVDFRLAELATEYSNNSSSIAADIIKMKSVVDSLDLSQAFSDFSACSSDISGELQRLSCAPYVPCSFEDGRFSKQHGTQENNNFANGQNEVIVTNEDGTQTQDAATEFSETSWVGYLDRKNLSVDAFENVSSENLEDVVNVCVDGLTAESVSVKRSAAARLRLLAKNRSENRAMIAEAGGVQGLIPLLKCSDPWTQEHAVTALFNLSLLEENKTLITDAGAIKPLVYVLKTGTAASKQNAACALLSLALIEDNKISIGVCGAIPPLVSLILSGSNRGKKDGLTTLYKLCSIKVNKERAVSAGAVKPLVALVSEQGSGLAEKAMVVLSSLAGILEGRVSIMEEGGIPALVEAIEDGSIKGKEFAVATLLQLCADCVTSRGLLVREGGIPPLVSLSQSGTARAKHKAETLLRYVREPRQEASCSSSPA